MEEHGCLKINSFSRDSYLEMNSQLNMTYFGIKKNFSWKSLIFALYILLDVILENREAYLTSLKLCCGFLEFQFDF